MATISSKRRLSSCKTDNNPSGFCHLDQEIYPSFRLPFKKCCGILFDRTLLYGSAHREMEMPMSDWIGKLTGTLIGLGDAEKIKPVILSSRCASGGVASTSAMNSRGLACRDHDGRSALSFQSPLNRTCRLFSSPHRIPELREDI